MYEVTKKTRSFDLNSKKDLLEYDKVLNNPMCSVIREIKEKVENKFMEDGKVVGIDQKLILVVTWQEKEIL